MKTTNKTGLQQFIINLYNKSDIDFKDFMEIYKKCTAERYSFLVNNTTLPSDNSVCFRKNFLE